MAWKRRRRRGGVWLPINGVDFSADIAADEPAYATENSRSASLNTDATDPGTIIWDATSVTFDATDDISTLSGGTLHDLVQGNEYRLHRAVGKCFVSVSQALGTGAGGTRLPAVHAGSGLIIVRTDDQGVPTTDFNFVNPLVADSAEDPWIWRRTWMFTTTPGMNNFVDLYTNQDATGYRDGPQNNMQYGSVLDGPHLDAKTRRHVHRSERLFWVNAIRGGTWDFTDDLIGAFQSTRVTFLLNIRLFATLIASSKGNRGNASR